MAAALTPGMRAITVPVNNQSGVAGFVFPGDRVDMMLTQSVAVAEGSPGLQASETILRNLRVLATDQVTNQGPAAEGAGMQPRISQTVTLEVTPRIAEKVAVAQTLGTITLSLRPLADTHSDLERAIASGSVKLPENATPEEEEKFLRQAIARPQDGRTSFVTGGDVSRFQSSRLPGQAAPCGQDRTHSADQSRRPGGKRKPGRQRGNRPWPNVRSGFGRPGQRRRTKRRRGNGKRMRPRVTPDLQRLKIMNNRFAATMLLAGIALTPLVSPLMAVANAQTVVRPNSQDVVLSIGRGQLISVNGSMADVFIANDSVADVQIKSQRQLYIFGKSGGTTTVYASNARGDVIWSANVRVGSNIDSIDQMLALAMPEAKIAVATMGTNTVLLTGTIAAPEDAAEAQRLVEAFTGGEANVISRLKTATPLQVNLRVRIAEVNRNFARTVGSNLLTVDQSSGSGFKFGITNGRQFTSKYTPGSPAGLGVGAGNGPEGATDVLGSGTGSTLAAFGRFLGLDIGAALDLAEQDNLATTLAEPNLTALSGETASFLAGGEIPLVTSSPLAGSTVTYKPYGVSLSYTPVVLSNGRISLRVKPEVSEITSVSVVGGVQTAALSTRSAETTVELGSGQSFMIAGLIQNNAINFIDKAPGLGDVPILGSLFRSTSFRRNETELVIVVTPYLVKPVDDRDIHLPTDGYRAPNELQRIFGNQTADGQTGARRPGPTAVQPESMIAPQISGGPASAVGTRAPGADPRREEKIADATPGFSFN